VVCAKAMTRGLPPRNLRPRHARDDAALPLAPEAQLSGAFSGVYHIADVALSCRGVAYFGETGIPLDDVPEADIFFSRDADGGSC
jgi:hypothetical protein